MAKKKLINSLLLYNSAFVIFIVVITLLMGNFTMRNIGDYLHHNDTFPKILAQDLIRADYEHVQIADLKKFGGWIEVIDAKGKVVFVKGNKQTPYTSYTFTQLARMRDARDRIYLSSMATFQQNGKEYVLLSIFPRSKTGPGRGPDPGHGPGPRPVPNGDLETNEKVRESLFQIIAQGLGLLILLVLILVVIYSKFSSEKINKPIGHIVDAIERMAAGDENVRIQMEVKNELAEIKDAFNHMANQLQKGKQERLKMEESRRQLFADISHDLKTPLSSIRGFVDALCDGTVQEETEKQRYLEIIKKKALKIDRLLSELFEFSKLELESFQMEMLMIDLTEVLREAIALHYDDLERSGLEPDISIPDQSIFVLGDAAFLERAFTNLISNSALHHENGKVFSVFCEKQVDTVYIRISDDGIGVAENVAQNIFDPFVRGESSRSTFKGGSGLGLSITKKIIERHRGDVRLLKTEKGFSVEIILPIDE